MSAAPRLLHDAPTDPLTLALAPLADAVAARVETRLDTKLAALVAHIVTPEPVTLRLDQVEPRTGLRPHVVRRILSHHPELKLTVGTSLLVRWSAFRAWLAEQDHIPGDDRPRRPAPRPSRREGGTDA